jgi:hypothetical protein
VQTPHEAISLPQPSPAGPQKMFCCAHVSGWHVPASGKPHWPGVPPPPHVSGGVQLPQLGISLPQPSPAGPQVMFWLWQVFATQVPPSGAPH